MQSIVRESKVLFDFDRNLSLENKLKQKIKQSKSDVLIITIKY